MGEHSESECGVPDCMCVRQADTEIIGAGYDQD